MSCAGRAGALGRVDSDHATAGQYRHKTFVAMIRITAGAMPVSSLLPESRGNYGCASLGDGFVSYAHPIARVSQNHASGGPRRD
jgi:hypothetical protein